MAAGSRSTAAEACRIDERYGDVDLIECRSQADYAQVQRGTTRIDAVPGQQMNSGSRSSNDEFDEWYASLVPTRPKVARSCVDRVADALNEVRRDGFSWSLRGDVTTQRPIFDPLPLTATQGVGIANSRQKQKKRLRHSAILNRKVAVGANYKFDGIDWGCTEGRTL